jgi:hypothetical protein
MNVNWSQSFTTFDRIPSVFSDTQHVNERLAVRPHYVFLSSTIRTDRMNSVQNTNMPHKLSICQSVNDTSLFPTQRQSFPAASAFLPTFKIK